MGLVQFSARAVASLASATSHAGDIETHICNPPGVVQRDIPFHFAAVGYIRAAALRLYAITSLVLYINPPLHRQGAAPNHAGAL